MRCIEPHTITGGVQFDAVHHLASERRNIGEVRPDIVGFIGERFPQRHVVQAGLGADPNPVTDDSNVMNDFLEYEQRFASKLRAEHSAKYRDKFVAFRTLLEVV